MVFGSNDCDGGDDNGDGDDDDGGDGDDDGDDNDGGDDDDDGGDDLAVTGWSLVPANQLTGQTPYLREPSVANNLHANPNKYLEIL